LIIDERGQACQDEVDPVSPNARKNIPDNKNSGTRLSAEFNAKRKNVKRFQRIGHRGVAKARR
jgi:hypothetical protein